MSEEKSGWYPWDFEELYEVFLRNIHFKRKTVKEFEEQLKSRYWSLKNKPDESAYNAEMNKFLDVLFEDAVNMEIDTLAPDHHQEKLLKKAEEDMDELLRRDQTTLTEKERHILSTLKLYTLPFTANEFDHLEVFLGSMSKYARKEFYDHMRYNGLKLQYITDREQSA